MQRSDITKCCSFGGKYQQRQAVSLGFHPDTFPLLSRCQICAFSLWCENTVMETVAQSVPVQAPLCLGDTRPARPPVPFMETVLGLIITSCASSPSPAGLCVPVSSASSTHSHWSQGEAHRRACTRTQTEEAQAGVQPRRKHSHLLDNIAVLFNHPAETLWSLLHTAFVVLVKKLWIQICCCCFFPLCCSCPGLHYIVQFIFVLFLLYAVCSGGYEIIWTHPKIFSMLWPSVQLSRLNVFLQSCFLSRKSFSWVNLNSFWLGLYYTLANIFLSIRPKK